VTCSYRISPFQDGGSFQLNPLVTSFRLIILPRIVTKSNPTIQTNCIRKYIYSQTCFSDHLY